MTIQGLIGSESFVGTDGTEGGGAANQSGGGERPLNWREGILMRFPNGHAPLTALTSRMKKKVTDDPQFNWWEREVSNVRFELGVSIPVTTDPFTLTLVADPFGFEAGDQLKEGDLLYAEETGEILRVTGATLTNTSVSVARSWGDVGALALTLGAGVNPHLTLIGSVYEEGADTPNSIRYRPTKHYNFTQIFRNSLKATRTALQTRLRTVDEVRDAKTQALLYHSIAMEYAFIFGDRAEDTGVQGMPRRSTGGVIYHIPAANKPASLEGTPLEWNLFENHMLEAFRFGSQEKVCFLGNRAMLAIQRMIRVAQSTSVELTPMQKEFGMDVRRMFTPFGTLVLKTHPLFNQIQSATPIASGYASFDTWMLILDMANITYRPLRNSDTQYLPDRQGNGIDGLTSEYLTECGLEVNHGKTHYLLKGVQGAAVETLPIVQ